jgi:GAF domain-containing protein
VTARDLKAEIMTDFDENTQPGVDPGDGAPVAVPNLRLVAQFEAAVAARVALPDPHEQLLPDRLCQAVVEVSGVQGAAISVYLGADIAIPIGASDLEATTGEALQFTVREGPCFSSYSRREPVLLPDLHRSDSQAWSDWPTYAEQLVRHTPYQAVFAYPLLKAGLAIGSLSLYQRSAGRPDDLAEFAGLVSCVTDRLLEGGTLIDTDGESEHSWMNGPTAMRRRRVWLAQGLTLQANRVTPGQALELLRAHAFSADRLLDDVADDIVSGRLPVPALESQQ